MIRSIEEINRDIEALKKERGDVQIVIEECGESAYWKKYVLDLDQKIRELEEHIVDLILVGEKYDGTSKGPST